MRFGSKSWKQLAISLNEEFHVSRTLKQCRDRWVSYLGNDNRKLDWTAEEIELLILSQAKHGLKWAKIAQEFPNKSENQIKNKFYAIIRKYLRMYNKGKPTEAKKDISLISQLTPTEISEALLFHHTKNLNPLSQKNFSSPQILPSFNEDNEKIRDFVDDNLFDNFLDVDEFFDQAVWLNYNK